MSSESRLTEILGDELRGERITCAVVAATESWYSKLVRGAGSHTWYLALTTTRVFIISVEAGGQNWRGLRNVRAQRTDVVVERFRRTGIMSWVLSMNVRTEGHWKLHGIGWVPGLRANSQNAKKIAESLGWEPRVDRR